MLPKPGHATRALPLRAVLGALGRPALDERRPGRPRSGKCDGRSAPPVRFQPSAPWPADPGIAPAPPRRVAAGAAVGAARRRQVVERLAVRGGGAVLDRLVEPRRRFPVLRVRPADWPDGADQCVVLADPAVAARSIWMLPEVGEQRVDLLPSFIGPPPARHPTPASARTGGRRVLAPSQGHLPPVGERRSSVSGWQHWIGAWLRPGSGVGGRVALPLRAVPGPRPVSGVLAGLAPKRPSDRSGGRFTLK